MSTMNMMSTMSSIILSGSFGQLKYEHVSVSSNTNAAEKGVKMAVYMTRINITQSHTAWNSKITWKQRDPHVCVYLERWVVQDNPSVLLVNFFVHDIVVGQDILTERQYLKYALLFSFQLQQYINAAFWL